MPLNIGAHRVTLKIGSHSFSQNRCGMGFAPLFLKLHQTSSRLGLIFNYLCKGHVFPMGLGRCGVFSAGALGFALARPLPSALHWSRHRRLHIGMIHLRQYRLLPSASMRRSPNLCKLLVVGLVEEASPAPRVPIVGRPHDRTSAAKIGFLTLNSN